MSASLFIPWFRAEAIHIPLPLLEKLPIQPFGLLVATGVYLAFLWSEKRAKDIGTHPAVHSDMVAHVLGFGFVAAHVLDAIFYHPEEVIRNPLYLFKLWAGLSSYGGFFGAILGGFVWRYRRGLSFLRIADPIVYAFPLGWLFGRTGCFVVHDHPGIQTDFFLAVAGYETGNPPFVPRHDLGLYEVFFSAAVIPLFLWLGRKPRPPGFFVGLLPTLYGPVRFGLDFLRITPAELGEHADPRYFGLTPGHYGSIAIFLIGVGVLWVAYNKPAAPLPPSAQWTPEAEAAWKLQQEAAKAKKA